MSIWIRLKSSLCWWNRAHGIGTWGRESERLKMLRISFLSLLYNTSRARDTRALPRFSYLASL